MVLESWGRGGTEAYVRSLAWWLRDKEIARVSLCLLKDPEAGVESGAFPDTIDMVHALGKNGGIHGYLRLYRLLKRERPDICHLHLYSSLLPAMLAVRAAGIHQVVTTLHMPLWQWHWWHRLGWRLALALSHFVMGNSSATLRSVGRWPAGDRTALVPPPLPGTVLGPRSVLDGERPKNISPRAFRIGGAGRLAPEKRWVDLIRAFARVAKETDAECELCLYGGGPERETLRMLARELGVAAWVRFNDFLPQRELHDAISECNVFVLPSRFEGLGMAAIEAMALGVPTITADFEASADFIEQGITGYTFPRGNVDALAKLLRWHRDHPRETTIIARRGQTFARKRFHPDVVFESIPEIYGLRQPDPHKMLLRDR